MTKQKRQGANIVWSGVCLAVAAFVLVSASMAWFIAFSGRTEQTRTIEVQEPPILYILDSDAEDIMQLSLSGLKIGETKRLVFCVSSVYPVEDDSYGIKGPFSLELVYTRNLGATFNIYSAQIHDTAGADRIEYYSQSGQRAYFSANAMLTGEDASESGNEISYGADNSAVQENNLATYTQYYFSDVDTDPNFNLRFSEPEQSNLTGIYSPLNCRFFILEITWDEMHSVDAKEADMIYILVKSGYRKNDS